MKYFKGNIGYVAGSALLLSSTLSMARAQTLAMSDAPEAFKKLSLEQLMETEVTSASRTPQKWSEVASAIYVLSQEDIHRSGVMTLADAFRFVPGMQVARLDSSTWAVSSRGFNSTTANKLQVLIDGRSIYTPLFSGVFWDVQDTMLEDIDRIEVIRGPGASVWGANAVNGVINVMSRSAKDTQGTLLTGGAGTEERVFGGVRYGGKFAENVYYRIYGKYFNRDDSALPNRDPALDEWQMGQGGFRIDWERDMQNRFTFQGDIYDGNKAQWSSVSTPTSTTMLNADTTVGGGNILSRWTHDFSEESQLQLQVYYDHTHRDIPQVFREDRDTGNIDLQHEIRFGSRNDFIWGLQYNITADEVGNTYSVAWDPPAKTAQTASAFLQDEFTLIEDRLKLTAGSKFEHNDYSGFEAQPTLRLAAFPNKWQTIWVAASRSVRTPTRIDTDVRINSFVPPATTLQALGNPEFGSEKVYTYELGYRVQPLRQLSFDTALFYNEYSRIRGVDFAPPTTFVIANSFDAETYGGEVAANYDLLSWWRLKGGYSFLRLQMHKRPGSTDTTSEVSTEGSDPRHQVFIRSLMDLPQHLQLDTALRYVDRLRSGNIPSYVAADFRLAWEPIAGLEFAIIAQNLLDRQHPEFSTARRNEIEQSIYGKVTWRF